jgi:hypothetical protein
VAGHGPVVGLSGSLADVQRVDDLTSALSADADPAGTADTPAAAELLAEFLAQQAPCLHEQRQVDRLVGHPQLRVVGELHRQPTSDLLG